MPISKIFEDEVAVVSIPVMKGTKTMLVDAARSGWG
jgi:hypothetical protein